MTRDTPTTFRHYTRVRIRVAGAAPSTWPRGRVLRCESRTTGRDYWKVKLDDGRWVWPDHVVIDGRGNHMHAACADCGAPFLGDAGALICDPCDVDAFGDRSTDDPIGQRIDRLDRARRRGR